MLTLKPQYVGFTPRKDVNNAFQAPLKFVSLKAKNDVKKVKNYFENIPREYNFKALNKNNIYVLCKDLNIYFKISLNNFFEIFKDGEPFGKKFQILFWNGKVSLGTDLDEDSVSYSAWYNTGKKNYTELINGGIYLDRLGHHVTFFEGLKPKEPHVYYGEVFDEAKLKTELENKNRTSCKKEDLIHYTGKIDNAYLKNLEKENENISYITDINLSEFKQVGYSPSHYSVFNTYFKDEKGIVYEKAGHYTYYTYTPITLSSGRVVYVTQTVSATDALRNKLLSLKGYAYIKFERVKNL